MSTLPTSQLTEKMVRYTRTLMRDVEPIIRRHSDDPKRGYQEAEKWLRQNERNIQRTLNLPNWKAPQITVHDDPTTFYRALETYYKGVLNTEQFKKLEATLQGFKTMAVAAFSSTTPDETTQVKGHLFIPNAAHLDAGFTLENASVHEVLHAIQATVCYALNGAEHINNYDEMLKLSDVRMDMMKKLMSPWQRLQLLVPALKSRHRSKMKRMHLFAEAMQKWEKRGLLKKSHEALSSLSLEELYKIKHGLRMELQAHGNGFAKGQKRFIEDPTTLRLNRMDSIADDINLPMYAVFLKITNQAIGIKKGHFSAEQIRNIRKYGTAEKPPFDWLKATLVTLGLGGLTGLGYLAYTKSQGKPSKTFEDKSKTFANPTPRG